MQIKIAPIIAMQKLCASTSPASGSSISITDKSWLNLLTTCPASVEVKKESGAFSTVSSSRPWRKIAERGIIMTKSMKVNAMRVAMATNSTAKSMPR